MLYTDQSIIIYVFGISIFRLHVLANTEDNSDTGDLELIRHLHVNVSSLKILLQGRKIYIFWINS